MDPDPNAPSRPSAPSGEDDGLARRQERERAVLGAGPGSEPGPPIGDPFADEDLFTHDDEEPQAPVPSSRRGRREVVPKSPLRNTLEWVAVIGGAIVIAVVVRTFVFQTFWIPTPSMSPTLVKNDRVIVNKLSYKFHDPNRGDVVVFERPPSEPPSSTKDLIKRVIGLPGDRVSILDGDVLIDGRVLEEPYVHGKITEFDDSCGPGDVTGINTAEGFEVPEGHLFVMGDNRTNSHDGRCFGPIDQDLVVGRAFFIIWPPSKAGGL